MAMIPTVDVFRYLLIKLNSAFFFSKILLYLNVSFV